MGALSRLSKADARAKMMELERKQGTHGLGLLLTSALGTAMSEDGAEGVRISRIYTGGVADRDGRLLELDKLLSINGVDVSHMKVQEVTQCLKGMGPEVGQAVPLRPPPPPPVLSYCAADVLPALRLALQITMIVQRSRARLVAKLVRHDDSSPDVTEPVTPGAITSM